MIRSVFDSSIRLNDFPIMTATASTDETITAAADQTSTIENMVPVENVSSNQEKPLSNVQTAVVMGSIVVLMFILGREM